MSDDEETDGVGGDAERPARRTARRPRVLKRASILNGVEKSEVQCTVRNMHEEGAELQVADGVQVPHEFLLYIPLDGIAYKSVLRWRDGARVGVMFIGTEAKPHWHYG